MKHTPRWWVAGRSWAGSHRLLNWQIITNSFASKSERTEIKDREISCTVLGLPSRLCCVLSGCWTSHVFAFGSPSDSRILRNLFKEDNCFGSCWQLFVFASTASWIPSTSNLRHRPLIRDHKGHHGSSGSCRLTIAVVRVPLSKATCFGCFHWTAGQTDFTLVYRLQEE